VCSRPVSWFEIRLPRQAGIKAGASDAHVPALLRRVTKIPYTRSGKKVEIAVRDLIAGIAPKNLGAIADASALDEYRAWGETGL
jgi:acetoacetyl-CoA synthetase